MLELWRMIKEFPDYRVSTFGQVMKISNGRILKQGLRSQGVPVVWMVQDGAQYCRAVPPLVAEAWLPPPEFESFDTPIQLNGDRACCRVDNLMWRPRWFAIKFHQERLSTLNDQWRLSFRLIETGEVFHHPAECATVYGILERDICMAIFNGTFTFPYMFRFEPMKNTY